MEEGKLSAGDADASRSTLEAPRSPPRAPVGPSDATEANTVTGTKKKHRHKSHKAPKQEPPASETWLQWFLGLFVMLDVQRVRRGDQRKACYCYAILLGLYLLAMLLMTMGLFMDRKHPPTSVQLVDDQEWAQPPPPNMMVCHWSNQKPRWLLGQYLSFDKNLGKYGKWVYRDEFRNRLELVECGNFKDHCVFVRRSQEGPERMGQFAQGRSLHFKVGYIIPVEGASPTLEGAAAAAASPMDLGLSLWFVHADSPEQLCQDTAHDDFSSVGGFSQAVAHLHGTFVPQDGGNKRLTWPYDILQLARTVREDINVRKDDKLATSTTKGWRYSANLIPSLNVTGPSSGHWTMPLLNSTERAGLEGGCRGEQMDMDLCYREEVLKRQQLLDEAGERGVYFDLQLWLTKQMAVVTEKDPVELVQLLSLWTGGWGWVVIFFGVFFWKTYYDTYAASTCLQVKFWRRAGQNVKDWATDPLGRRRRLDKKKDEEKTGHGEEGWEEKDEEAGHAGEGTGYEDKVVRQSPNTATPVRFPGCSSTALAPSRMASVRVNQSHHGRPLPAALEFDSVYLDLQDMHPDLRRMQQWFLQHEEQQRLRSPQDEEEEEEEEEEEGEEEGGVETARAQATTNGHDATK